MVTQCFRTSVLLGIGGLISLGCMVPGRASAPAGPTCKERVLHAYTLLLKAQQARQNEVAVVRFTAESVAVPPGKKDAQKTTSRFLLMSRQGHTYLSNGEVDLYQDGKHQVSVLHDQHLIMITLTDGPTAAQTAPWLRIRDELLNYMQGVECKTLTGTSGPERIVRLVPVPTSKLIGKIKTVEYRLNTQTDALRKVTVYYPSGSGIVSSAVTFQSQSWKSQDPTVDRAALRQVFGADNKVLAAYRSFEIQDYR